MESVVTLVIKTLVEWLTNQDKVDLEKNRLKREKLKTLIEALISAIDTTTIYMYETGLSDNRVSSADQRKISEEEEEVLPDYAEKVASKWRQIELLALDYPLKVNNLVEMSRYKSEFWMNIKEYLKNPEKMSKVPTLQDMKAAYISLCDLLLKLPTD